MALMVCLMVGKQLAEGEDVYYSLFMYTHANLRCNCDQDHKQSLKCNF